jgi:hypothetical protein
MLINFSYKGALRSLILIYIAEINTLHFIWRDNMLEFMQKMAHKTEKNKKGVTAIEMVIGVMIFILLISFMMDVLILFWKFSVVSQTTTQIARITGLQGGALRRSDIPDDWPDKSGYLDIEELNDIIDNKMKTANIDNWVMTIDRGKIGTTGVSATPEIDYKENFTVKTTIDYKWDFMSNFIPGMDIEQSITAKRPAMSEWKYNYSNWIGE